MGKDKRKSSKIVADLRGLRLSLIRSGLLMACGDGNTIPGWIKAKKEIRKPEGADGRVSAPDR